MPRQKFLSASDWIHGERLASSSWSVSAIPDQLTVVGWERCSCSSTARVAPLLSRHPGGSGGYIISREKAALLVGMTQKIDLPIDQLLFNPTYSPVFRALSPWQLIPAILEQTSDVGGATDIRHTKHQLGQKLKRNKRAFRALPQLIASVLIGRARAVRNQACLITGSASRRPSPR